jgi:hypothetical protein
MVGKTMKDTYTLLETIKTSDGKTILFKKEHLVNFFKKTYEENYLNLSDTEKEEAFQVDQEYGDLLVKIIKEPLQKVLEEASGAAWALQDEERNPIEEYEHALSLPKDNDLSDEEHGLKMERLRLHKEWYEKQIN